MAASPAVFLSANLRGIAFSYFFFFADFFLAFFFAMAISFMSWTYKHTRPVRTARAIQSSGHARTN